MSLYIGVDASKYIEPKHVESLIHVKSNGVEAYDKHGSPILDNMFVDYHVFNGKNYFGYTDLNNRKYINIIIEDEDIFTYLSKTGLSLSGLYSNVIGVVVFPSEITKCDLLSLYEKASELLIKIGIVESPKIFQFNY